ncbi:MAG: hypothetical protein NXH95_13005 [Pseudomonadaceae bacterium]|nr:hypothetical protein [Pseudomonadaceae bacterium]
MTAFKGPERRKGNKDRRVNKQDRRNDDRILEDPLPRRSAETSDRRKPQ